LARHLSFAKLDFVLDRRRKHGTRDAVSAAGDLLLEWVGRQLFRLEYPTVEWGRGVRIKGKLVFRGAGRVVIGDECIFDSGNGPPNSIILSGPDARVVIGEGTYLNGATILAAESVVVGPQCVLADCLITDSDFHPVDPEARVAGEPGKVRPVVIERRAWLGRNVVIMKGVSVGEEAVIGAGSVVRRDVPARTVVTVDDPSPRFEIGRKLD
jgi:acetyltransferase-like isoleucine patch superfamily enzyme